MSIFKVKHWWANEQENASNSGLQNGGCLKVDRFDIYADSDLVLIAEDLILKIYKPSPETTQAVLETKFSDSILQIETGKFVVDNESRQILILHPQSYVVYDLRAKEGHTDAGDQNSLHQLTKHSFTRKSYSAICGPFGNIKTRELICIQGIDGSLSFFDQNTFLFMCIFDDVIIPGPVCYVGSSDCFVICKSTWVLEIYSYQQLRESSELSSRPNKKSIPQWVYNAGEEVSDLQVIKTSNNISSVIALSERHLCCFQDNGLMKYILKFDYMPICFHAYLIGWYYEPGARLLTMVASEDTKLYIYEGSLLLWSCDLLNPTISLSRCFIKNLPGGLVTLSPSGVVNVGYFGTEPNLNPSNVPVIKETLDVEEIQYELESTEEQLRKILDNTQDAVDDIAQIVKIKADIGKPNSKESQEITNEKLINFCSVIVIITCNDPKFIQNIQITYACKSPFTLSDHTICLDIINGTEIIETQVILSSDANISDSSIKIVATILDSDGKIRIITNNVMIPLSLYLIPRENMEENPIKLNVNTNKSCIRFQEIFTDYSPEDLATTSSNDVTFAHRLTNEVILIKSSDSNYTIETTDYTQLVSILPYFILKLKDHYHRMDVKDFKFNLNLEEDFVKQLLHSFLKCIEAHAKDRSELKRFEDQLNVLQRQFTTVQKRLLVQYGSLPPGDCDPLEFLMNDTHERLINTVNDILRCRDNVIRTGCTLSAVGNLIVYLLKHNLKDDFKVKLIEEIMSFDSLYDINQEWQESVIQSLPYIMSVFNKSEKDKEKLAPVTEQGMLSNINMKRFLKQIRLILDMMFKEITHDIKTQKGEKEKVTRIEELVDVI